MDIKLAYQNVPVHPVDRTLLGMTWEGDTYVDTTLPFGLRLAPLRIILGPGYDTLEWIMRKSGVGWLAHYVHLTT